MEQEVEMFRGVQMHRELDRRTMFKDVLRLIGRILDVKYYIKRRTI